MCVFVDFEKPLFKQGLMSMDSLHSGCELTGRVMNLTHFGAFVDVGVGQDGLVHTSQMIIAGRRHQLKLGEKIQVVVQSVDVNRKRIGLKLINIL